MKSFCRRVSNAGRLLKDAWRGGAPGRRLLLALLVLLLLSVIATTLTAAANGLVYTLF
jgi:hypothetical protein